MPKYKMIIKSYSADFHYLLIEKLLKNHKINKGEKLISYRKNTPFLFWRKRQHTIYSEIKMDNFPMNEIYQLLIDNRLKFHEKDHIFIQQDPPVDPITNEKFTYIDMHPATVLQEAKKTLEKFYGKGNKNVES